MSRAEDMLGYFYGLSLYTYHVLTYLSRFGQISPSLMFARATWLGDPRGECFGVGAGFPD